MFSLGRDAFWHLAITEIAPDGMEVWLPAYSCSQLRDAFSRAGVRVNFYDVAGDLSVDWHAVAGRRAARSGRHALVFIDYFGFPASVPVEVRDNLFKSFDIVIRDAAHSLPCTRAEVLSGSRAGFVVYSLRKPLPIADLALVYATGDTALRRSARGASRWLFAGVESAGLFIPPVGRSRTYRRLRGVLKERGGLGARPSAISRFLVPRFDHGNVAQARQRAGRRLLTAWKEHALIPKIDSDACPYYLPVALSRPDAVRRVLERQGIETTRFWQIDGELRGYAGACGIADSMLCLPVHQCLNDRQLAMLCEASASVSA
jgi:hypothetical protein